MDLEKGLNHIRIKMGSFVPGDERDAFFMGEGRFIGSPG